MRRVQIFVMSRPCLFEIYAASPAAARRVIFAANDAANNDLLIAKWVAAHKFLPQLCGLRTFSRQREVFHHLQLPDVG